MPGIIKADREQLRTGVSGVSFNLDDVTDKARRCLEDVRSEAAQIVAQARSESDQIRKQAEEEGRRHGMQLAEQLLSQRIEQQLAQSIPALNKAIDAVQGARLEWLGHWEKNLLRLAQAIAAKVIRREVVQSPEITLQLVQESLDLASRSNRVKLRLNPRDRELLGEHLQQIVARMGRVAETEIIADADISVGGCKVTTEFGEIDQQFETQLRRIAEELS